MMRKEFTQRHAALAGRDYASIDDVRAVALPVLRHRLIPNFNAESDKLTTDDIIRRLIDDIGSDRDSGGLRGLSKMLKS